MNIQEDKMIQIVSESGEVSYVGYRNKQGVMVLAQVQPLTQEGIVALLSELSASK